MSGRFLQNHEVSLRQSGILENSYGEVTHPETMLKPEMLFCERIFGA